MYVPYIYCIIIGLSGFIFHVCISWPLSYIASQYVILHLRYIIIVGRNSNHMLRHQDGYRSGVIQKHMNIFVRVVMLYNLSLEQYCELIHLHSVINRLTYMVVSRGAVRSAASSYAAVRMVAGSRPVLVIAWEWHIGLALLCGCSGALEYPTTSSCGPINKSLSLSLSLYVLECKGSKEQSR